MPSHTKPPTTIDSAREWANRRLVEIEAMLKGDCLTIISTWRSSSNSALLVSSPLP